MSKASAAVFFEDLDSRALVMEAPPGIIPRALFLGAGAMGLEVAVFDSVIRPTPPQLRELHRGRVGRRAAPVLVVVLWGDNRAALCGSPDDSVVVALDSDRVQVERLCRAALDAPDRHGAIRFLAHALPQLNAKIPGLRNAGLFALHELEEGAPRRADWEEARRRGEPILALRGRELIRALDYSIESLPGPASVLLARGTKVAVAVFLERPDEIEPPDARFDGLSAISFALAKADQENLDYVVVSAGSVLRIYPVKPGVGTGRRGRTETFVELNLDLLRDQDSGHLWLLCSAEALSANGTFTQVLEESTIFAANLGTRLRERVYGEVVPGFARALVEARRLRRPSTQKLAETYEMALLVLFRLLFVAYAEDKELLPLQANRDYRAHSLKEIARRLQSALLKQTSFEDQDFYWNEVSQLWKAIAGGNTGWGVPAYNGGLFASDEDAQPAAQALADISITDRGFGPPLVSLLLDDAGDGVLGPIDFRSLGVREFGTIYEGLLESELSVAETDLSVDPRSLAFVPTKKGTLTDVPAGVVYLHNASGARKASGAYYTKPFAVDHLLDHALEPALEEHLGRLDSIADSRQAADQFFDFRVADIAMGSGHFLVGAIDRVERRLSNYLARRPLSGVTDELERLRTAALKALGEDWDGEPIEDARLLRRQIARRCIYGVDLNPLAVELARLSVWIHTFVPGLPLSFLDHNLVVGNSLVGIATFEEASELIGVDSGEIFSLTAGERLKAAREPIEKLAKLADANAAEISAAKRLYAEARERIAGESDLLTVLTASRLDAEVRSAIREGNVATRTHTQGDIFAGALVRKAEQALAGLKVLHFPIAFPEVFLGSRWGFDVILGNPPWEEATVEEDAFWARHFPGLRSLPQREQETRKVQLRKERSDLAESLARAIERAAKLRSVLTSGPYPGMGTGDPDLYKAFCWRFWNLVSPKGGRFGVVLPRSALAAKGSAEFRKEVFQEARDVDVTMLLNNRQWVFPEVHPQYTIGLVCITRAEPERTSVGLRGPYSSRLRYDEGMVREPAVFYGQDILGWNDTASLPLLPTEQSAAIFAKLRRAPRLDLNDGSSWRARPYTELHATNDKDLMDLKSKECPEGSWPVFKGESFDIWTPDTGTYYAWANPERVLPALQKKRLRSARGTDSAFAEFDVARLGGQATLPCMKPRVAFRDISNRTNQRTVIAALVPGKIFITNKGPYFLWPRGDERDEAFLLGVLSSVPLDWYARRFVELSLNFFILNPFPVPRPDRSHVLWLRTVEIAGQLAARDGRFAAWARAVGVRPRSVPSDEQDELVTELDAAVAHLYGLTEKELVHVFETFHEGWDYSGRLERTLAHFRQLAQHA